MPGSRFGMMSRLFVFIFLVLTAAVGSATAKVDFSRDIRPILSANCFSCHGPDEKARKGKLRLDTADGARKALGQVEESELLYRIETDDEDDLMPPRDTGHVLTARQKGLLREWVAAGAAYEAHWAFVAPIKEKTAAGTHRLTISSGLDSPSRA